MVFEDGCVASFRTADREAEVGKVETPQASPVVHKVNPAQISDRTPVANSMEGAPVQSVAGKRLVSDKTGTLDAGAALRA